MKVVADSRRDFEEFGSSSIRVLGLAAALVWAAACAPGPQPVEPTPQPPGDTPAEQPADAPTPPPAPTDDDGPPAPSIDPDDPRVGLEGGWHDAESASENLELIAHLDRPEGFYDPDNLGDILLANTDIGFRDDYLFMGSFHGFNIYDISDPDSPELRTSFVCPGGQGDVTVYEDLLFMSVEMPNARVDCGTTPPQQRASPDRFLGVRIFDVSDLDNPVQITGVQTCRGSHTHTLVTDANDDENIYIYVAGTSPVRPAEELEGCSGLPPEEDPETAYFRIEVIQVPLASPEDAQIINEPRIFADPETGDIAGLWPGGEHGPGTQETRTTNQCHDITAYPDIGRAAGACAGNGILLDITDPAVPVRLDEVVDPNFAYWHSATFSNDGSKVLFTDEWGGGTAPRCLPMDDPKWGADAIFRLEGDQLDLAGYYKLPAPQTAQENCVAHNGSLVPVPGRDIMVQAWYQGGVSILDFTDPENPFEIAYFDRGPLDPSQLLLGGYWSSYWYNGHIYGSEIGRGLDVFELTPSEHLTESELEAARLVEWDQFNPQHQTRIEWPADFAVARALVDQLQRDSDLPADRISALAADLEEAEGAAGDQRQQALSELAATAGQLEARADSGSADERRLQLLAETLNGLAGG